MVRVWGKKGIIQNIYRTARNMKVVLPLKEVLNIAFKLNSI